MTNKPNNNINNPLNKYFIMSYIGFICGMWTAYLIQLYGIWSIPVISSVIVTAVINYIAIKKVPENGY